MYILSSLPLKIRAPLLVLVLDITKYLVLDNEVQRGTYFAPNLPPTIGLKSLLIVVCGGFGSASFEFAFYYVYYVKCELIDDTRLLNFV